MTRPIRVHFTNRLRAAARSRDIAELCQNLDTCLRGEAAKWWNNEVDLIMQTGLIHSLNIEDWCKQIKKRFRMPPSQAIGRLAKTRYTLLDVNRRKSPSSYVSTIVASMDSGVRSSSCKIDPIGQG